MNPSFSALVKYLCQLQKISPITVSKEQAQQLEWFIKRTAVEAVNDKNKDEFSKILQQNDLEKLSQFITAYVPNFSYKLQTFLNSCS